MAILGNLKNSNIWPHCKICSFRECKNAQILSFLLRFSIQFSTIFKHLFFVYFVGESIYFSTKQYRLIRFFHMLYKMLTELSFFHFFLTTRQIICLTFSHKSIVSDNESLLLKLFLVMLSFECFGHILPFLQTRKCWLIWRTCWLDRTS